MGSEYEDRVTRVARAATYLQQEATRRLPGLWESFYEWELGVTEDDQVYLRGDGNHYVSMEGDKVVFFRRQGGRLEGAVFEEDGTMTWHVRPDRPELN